MGILNDTYTYQGRNDPMEKASEEELSGLIQPDTTRLNKN
jgi:hypothetical protein